MSRIYTKPSPVRTVVIVGAGFSGTMTAVNLLRNHVGSGLRVVLIERNSRPGRGLAYRTWDDNFVLNVPAGNMSAFVDRPDHFVQYCQAIDPAFNTGSFVSRRIYGDYLETLLRDAVPFGVKASLEFVQGEVTAVRRSEDGAGYKVTLLSGHFIDTDIVVLAFGHFAPRNFDLDLSLVTESAYIADPWNVAALDAIPSEASVALIGAGHTAVDVAFRLTRNSDARKVYLISRRGLKLVAHRSHPHPPQLAQFPEFLDGLPVTVRAYCRALRQQAQSVMKQGGDWRDVVNTLRQYVPGIWGQLTLRERVRFLSKLEPYWNIHRHRLAPTAFSRLTQLFRSKQIEAIAGEVLALRHGGAGLFLEVKERHSVEHRSLSIGAVVNCTGPNHDISRILEPMMQQMCKEGYLLQDETRLGFEVDKQYRVLNCRGSTEKGMFYIGPMLKAKYWEATAVPELREHASRLAKILAAELS